MYDLEKETDLRILPLVQVHTDRIDLLERPVKVRFKVPLGSERFCDMPNPSMLGMQLHRLEVFDVLSIEKHVSDSSCLFVHLERYSGEDDTFGDDPRWVW